MNSDFHSLPPDEPSVFPDDRSESLLPTRDRFELLSAYMDGEVTAAERQQVEDWLVNDPSMQALHGRLLALRDGFQSMPVPTSAQSTQQTIDGVFARLDRRPKRRLVWGGAALAAGLVGAVSLLFAGEGAFQTAKNPAQSPAQSVDSADKTPKQEAILIALDKPVVMIPKAAVSAPATLQNAGTSSKTGN
jgi:anti-sigma factor RsiW